MTVSLDTIILVISDILDNVAGSQLQLAVASVLSDNKITVEPRDIEEYYRIWKSDESNSKKTNLSFCCFEAAFSQEMNSSQRFIMPILVLKIC